MDNEKLNYMGSFPSNIEPNPREQINAINVQDEEGFVEPKPEPRQETMVSKGQGELTLRVGDETITLQARNSGNTSEIEGDHLTHSAKTDNMNELNTFPHQLTVGDEVLLDAADPYIVTTTPNEEIPLTVLSIFPFGTVEVSHPKFDTFKCLTPNLLTELLNTGLPHRHGKAHGHGPTYTGVGEANNARHASATQPYEPTRPRYTMSSSCGKKATVPTSKKRKETSSSSGLTAETVMTNYNDPGTMQFCLGGLICQLSIPEFCTALGLYTEEFKEKNDLHALNRHIHRSPSHQTERHRKGVISIGPYVTQLARHFGLLSTAVQESSLTLIGQMFPQGISSMLSMRMIEKRQGTCPPQYRLAQSTKEKAHEDIPDDVPPQHEDPLTQPPPPSRPVHAAAPYANISEHLTQFEQQCFQRFDNIDATLQQICQHLNISSPVLPREPSSDEDV
ncbi:hypothetical protein GOBAR_AA00438 [Gossypium barbadense]|uniref:Uncharacterized protein n=1 Tax=Gossypium barbadense TaxID=3634 RepID=A0A2P5YX01_GOSBA|nr:hypothetical protein GOBAR_AA00438 [Gossypium barbadense]